jgi:O-methyltransferase
MTGRLGLSLVGETLLTPLYAKANAQRLLPGAGFDDPLAARLLNAMDYDPERVPTGHNTVAGAVYRTMALDDATVVFARQHPTGQVVSAGIGLCTRHARLAGRIPDTIDWYGVDTDDVIQLRRELLPDDPVHLAAASIIDPAWTTMLDAARPTLLIAEGVLMYLDPAGLTGFLGSAREHFGAGLDLVADYFHPKLAFSGTRPIVRRTGVQFRSGARNGAALAALTPGYTLVAEYPVMERIGPARHLAARAFQTLSGGGRAYAIAHLRSVPAAEGRPT